MDITDWTKGIDTDTDRQDAGSGTAQNLVNADTYPGYLEKREGTATKTYPLTDGGSIPRVDEEIIQIVKVHAPLAKVDTEFQKYQFSNVCTLNAVTVILTRVDGANEYRLYHNGLYGTFDQVSTPDNTGLILGANDDLPFMLPMTGAVDIGNVMAYTLVNGLDVPNEPGVLRLVHMKQLAMWMRNSGTGTYGYARGIDEWRLSNAECYDSQGQLKCILQIANYEALSRNLTAGTHPFYQRYQVPGSVPPQYYTPQYILDKGVLFFLLGERKRSFNIKVTAQYDHYQESRPLTWDSNRYEMISIADVGMGFTYATAELPTNWRILSDPDYNQYMRVEIEDNQPHTTAIVDTTYPNQTVPGSTMPINGLTWYAELVWNNVWFEGQHPHVTGEGFYVQVTATPNSDTYGVDYNWIWSGNIRQGLQIVIRGDGDDEVRRMWTPKFIMFLLGEDPGDLSHVQAMRVLDPTSEYWLWVERMFHVRHSEHWSTCRSLWTIGRVEYGVDLGLVAPGTPPDPYHPIADDIFTIPTFEFKLNDRLGLGMLQVCPLIPKEYIDATNFATNGYLIRGGRRLTGFQIYIKEDVVDIDYRLISRIPLDYNGADPKHGGFEEEDEDIIVTYREGGRRGAFPTWMNDGTYYRPAYFPDSAVAPIRGGVNPAFLISDRTLKTRVGVSSLSANMMRDETKRDNPTWIRAAIFEGRLFGIVRDVGYVEHCIFSEGVPQHNIMSDEKVPIAPGERLTHLVSFRGQHHLVFTDQNLWRIDLADGDEFNWRVLDTYAYRGTECWRAIVNTPAGIVYPNPEGIWLYDGNHPQDIITGRWSKEYRRRWKEKIAYDKTYGAFQAGRAEVHFSLYTGADPDDEYPDVWLFSFPDKSWRKYRYMGLDGNYGRPHYMTWFEKEFLQSFDEGDFRCPTELLTDVGLPYPFLVLSQEVPPIDLTTRVFFQYMGVKYTTPLDYPAIFDVFYAPYNHDIHDRRIVAPARHEYFFPLPMGMSRNMRFRYAQGWLADQPTNSDEPVILNSVSLRGAEDIQWSGTR